MEHILQIFLKFAAIRVVAQSGSALRSGRRGRRFKSCQPDIFIPFPRFTAYPAAFFW